MSVQENKKNYFIKLFLLFRVRLHRAEMNRGLSGLERGWVINDRIKICGLTIPLIMVNVLVFFVTS